MVLKSMSFPGSLSALVSASSFPASEKESSIGDRNNSVVVPAVDMPSSTTTVSLAELNSGGYSRLITAVCGERVSCFKFGVSEDAAGTAYTLSGRVILRSGCLLAYVAEVFATAFVANGFTTLLFSTRK